MLALNAVCVFVCVCRLICDADDRLGRSGISDFQNHPFFSGVDWDRIRSLEPPYVPEYTSDTDTRNFEPYEPEEDHSRHHVSHISLVTCM